jgi:hypothetical protein
MIIKDLYQISNYELLKPTYNQRNIRVYPFNQISFSGFSNHYPDVLLKCEENNYLVLPIKEMSMSLNKKSYYEENGMTYEDTSTNQYREIEESGYFFIYNTENYYHFIYDTLPYLWSFFKLREREPHLKLIMSYNQHQSRLLPFVEESLQLLGITQDDILIHEHENQYRQLYLGNSLTHDGYSNCPPRKEIFEIYQRMVSKALTIPLSIQCHDKVYISRRTWINKKTDNIGTNYTTRRKLMNEDQLVENLQQLGFQEVFGENYSMTQKIHLFYYSKIIVGAIGGTISNCVFCHPQTRIITIVSPVFLNLNSRMKFLFNEQVDLYEDTQLDCLPGEIPKNVRVQIIDPLHPNYRSLGEIDSKVKDQYSIKLAKNLIGFSQDEKYSKILVKKEQLKTLDKGINSPYFVNIKPLLTMLSDYKI